MTPMNTKAVEMYPTRSQNLSDDSNAKMSEMLIGHPSRLAG